MGRRLNKYKDNINKRFITLTVFANKSYYYFLAINHSAIQGRHIEREAHSVKAYIQRALR